ncbi:MAG TPA: AAA family ATPase, partial [Gemmatimonadaceae bacterium]|nr:AAA family ATPase [Gemmatimonadaceae bacterium]
GHLQGDAVLRSVATLLRDHVGDAGLVGRYAGDEFVALLTQATATEARDTAERLRDALGRTEIALRDREGSVVRVTISVGVAVATPEHREFEGLFAAADSALFEAKRRGRDGVFVAEMGVEPTFEPAINLKQFVGRDEELRRLMRALEASGNRGANVVAVLGEAGVGKSTLVRQLTPEVRLRAGSLVSGRCLEADAKPPYAPWVDVIGAIHHLGIVGPRDWRELPRVVAALGSTSPEGTGNKYTLFDEIAEYLRLAAASRPLVIILDDMQWADSASWDVLEHLLAHLQQERVLICLTLRSEDVRGEVLLRRNRLSRDERFQELPVPRLSESELEEWLSNVLGGRPAEANLVAYVHRVSEGNPLLATQLLRVLLDDDGIRFTSGRWELGADPVRLPAAVTGLMDRRLERLSPETRRILMAAAVIGRVFDVDLAVAAEIGTEDELLDAVDEGISHTVIEPASEESGTLFSFTHSLLVDAIKRSANPRRLARLHARIAAAMEARGSHDIAELTVHYDRGGVRDKAYACAMAAGSNAVGVYAHAEARSFFEIAVRSADGDPSRARALRELAGVEETEGRYARTEELCERALTLLSNRAGPGETLPLRRMRERMRALQGQPPQVTIAQCRPLLDEAVAIRDRAEEAALLSMISQGYSRLGQLHEARLVSERAADAAESTGNARLFAEALLRLGTTVMEGGEEDACPYYQRALALFREVGDRCGEARCSINLGILRQRNGDAGEAEEHYEAALTTARAAYAVDLIGLASLNLGVLYMRRGNLDLARERFDEALERFTESSSELHRVATLYNIARLAAETGDWPGAATVYEEVAAQAARIGQPDVELGARAGRGLAALAIGERLGAEDAMRWLRAHTELHTDWWFQGRELVDTLRVRLTADRGDEAHAFRVLREAVEVAARHDVYAAAHMIAECATSLPAHAGPLSQLLDEFAARVGALGFPALAARLSNARASLAVASSAA